MSVFDLLPAGAVKPFPSPAIAALAFALPEPVEAEQALPPLGWDAMREAVLAEESEAVLRFERALRDGKAEEESRPRFIAALVRKHMPAPPARALLGQADPDPAPWDGQGLPPLGWNTGAGRRILAVLALASSREGPARGVDFLRAQEMATTGSPGSDPGFARIPGWSEEWTGAALGAAEGVMPRVSSLGGLAFALARAVAERRDILVHPFRPWAGTARGPWLCLLLGGRPSPFAELSAFADEAVRA